LSANGKWELEDLGTDMQLSGISRHFGLLLVIPEGPAGPYTHLGTSMPRGVFGGGGTIEIHPHVLRFKLDPDGAESIQYEKVPRAAPAGRSG